MQMLAQPKQHNTAPPPKYVYAPIDASAHGCVPLKAAQLLAESVQVKIISPECGVVGEGLALAGKPGRKFHFTQLPEELHLLQVDKVNKDIDLGGVPGLLDLLSTADPEFENEKNMNHKLSTKLEGFVPWPLNWMGVSLSVKAPSQVVGTPITASKRSNQAVATARRTSVAPAASKRLHKLDE